ncbi:hypothetical protein [Ectobacillus panaciterrae]|uniref:hypothetical protein n=1 Tax=Ectobacillus panaciterrae TaxID=363872 RepID=UPI0003F5A108|nr:hypothetical protein [Ectobacillus panaciterrae]
MQGQQKPHGKIHIKNIDATEQKTEITVKIEGMTKEKNPMLIFHISSVPGEIEIKDTEGNKYEQIQE